MISRKFFVLVVLISASCSDSGTSMIGQLDATTIINPNVEILTSLGPIHARLLDNNEIIGTANGYVFHTTDEFETFTVSQKKRAEDVDLSRIAWLASDTIISYMETLPPPGVPGGGLVISISIDKGQNWENKSISGPITNSFKDIQFVNPQTCFLVQYNQRQVGVEFERITEILKIDLERATAESVGSVPGLGYKNIKFVDTNNGYMMMSDDEGVYLTRTSDGGATWIPPIKINGGIGHMTIVPSNGNLIAYGFGVLQSKDQGNTWVNNPLTDFIANETDGNGIKQITFASSMVGYARDFQDKIFRSTDGGETWSLFSKIDSRVSSFRFYDEQNGLATGQNTLLITHDGGLNWKPLIYPYPYVWDND